MHIKRDGFWKGRDIDRKGKEGSQPRPAVDAACECMYIEESKGRPKLHTDAAKA